MLEACLAETGVAAARAVMIGDTTYDMDMAHAAGIASIGVAWGYHGIEHLRRSGAGHILDGFEALPDALCEANVSR
jgi:phosphoglycolate phosphatase